MVTARLPLPLEKEPLTMEGEVLLTLRKTRPHRTRRYYAVLTKGYLQLFTNKQNPAYKYQIDLSKVVLDDEGESIIIGFRVSSNWFLKVRLLKIT
ncbi:unnamed protein product [Strongylus vulgaris]|uniref:PH domain-containing protein n=1 Tax=Strongylus vulgaris TaxID=40348 RepID=A0A3P7J351_STRVU|nr:unnamed protein product [Strongylus vulgaris]